MGTFSMTLSVQCQGPAHHRQLNWPHAVLQSEISVDEMCGWDYMYSWSFQKHFTYLFILLLHLPLKVHLYLQEKGGGQEAPLDAL